MVYELYIGGTREELNDNIASGNAYMTNTDEDMVMEESFMLAESGLFAKVVPNANHVDNSGNWS